jgi:DNA-binding transcriptional regulator GbsR (MarR family)
MIKYKVEVRMCETRPIAHLSLAQTKSFEREKYVWYLRHAHKKTLSDISEILGVSKERVRQMVNRQDRINMFTKGWRTRKGLDAKDDYTWQDSVNEMLSAFESVLSQTSDD